ncbi:AsmA family protein [Pedobacter jamesrossensis]|uniref:AsmA-like C-terminal region n=1 Tax=Pedobacter jamesrossensis TaxID=1908238 RepID=A0ABV8NJT7_9SPHI
MTAQNKLWIWITSIIGGLILILAFGVMFLSARWKPLLSEKIKDGIYTGSRHLYKIDFKSINLNIVTGSLVLKDVTLLPDTAVFDSLKSQKLAPAHIFELKLKKLEITGVGILTAYFKKKVNVNAIILNKPSINMIFNKVEKLSDTAKGNKTLYEQISKTFKSLHIKSLKIVDADFDYIHKTAIKKTKHSIKHLDISVNDFLLDSLSGNDTSRFYYTKDISFQLAGYKSTTKDKMYSMKMDTVSGSAASKKITVKGLKLIPLYPELTFARKYKIQKDRYNLDFDRIEFNGVDFIGLNTDEKLHAKSLRIGQANVEVFMSRESPPPPLDKGQNYPHLALKRLNIPIIIDTIKIRNINLKYSEYNPASKKTGSVEFKRLTGNILNLTNDTLQLKKNNHAIADLNALLMGTGKLNVKLNFNLTDKNGAFSYSGNLGNFDMKGLNSLSKNLGLIEIESGNIQKLAFKADANLRSANGSMSMLYTNLKVKLLSDNIDGEGTKEKGFLSFLANTVLVKDDNPVKGEAPRTAKMTNTRINSASFFNLMWKAVFIGIKDIVGVGVVPEKNPVKQQKVIAEKIKEQKQADKKEKREKN